MSDLRTLWFMGAKTRLIPEFIAGAIQDMVADGSTILDVCSGTSVVARSLAHRYRVYTNDCLRFCAVVASAHLESDLSWRSALETLDPELDLDRAFRSNLEQLTQLCPQAIEAEQEFLEQLVAAGRTPDPGLAQRYRAFCESTPTLDGDTPDPELLGSLADAIPLLLSQRRQQPDLLPGGHTTLYHGNLYFGLRQSMVIDAWRSAIASIPESDPHCYRKQALYLAALVYAASVSTSGTSHFAQPRSLKKDSELSAVAKRRSIDIELEFHKALDAIRREWGGHARDLGNRVFQGSAMELLQPGGELGDDKVDLVYFDPPYTTDNHSRFYHVLETLVDYDYPELEERGGELTKGRYPVKEKRFSSEFCKASEVEQGFRDIAAACAARGASLLVSYADTGLLLKQWVRQGEEQPLRRFRELFRDYFPRVEVRDQSLMHSGQGDSNLEVQELLVLCELDQDPS